MKSVLKTGYRTLAALLVAAAFSAPAFAGASPPNSTPVPEIDPGSALSAVTLLVGGVLILSDKCRAR